MTFEKALLKLFHDVADIKRRLEGVVARGTVHEVDPKTGTVRLKIGQDDDGNPFLTPPIPYAQTMGALKMHSPPSVGQQMTAISDGGDYRQGLAMPMTQSDSNKSPSEQGNEHVMTFGSAKVELRGNELVVTVPKVKFVCGGSEFELTGDGLRLAAQSIDLTGSELKHNSKSVGHNHTHIGVMPGGGTTGVPS